MFISVTPDKTRSRRHFNPMPVEGLSRDKGQSRLLHEPNFRISNIDPMTGEDITNVLSHPSLVDGNLTIYFQSDHTRKDYINMPLNHPSLHLQFEASIDDDRGG